MTALKEFQRLECAGIWRATADAQRRDVIVSLGDSTLVISDQKGTALTHWSLPAIERLNPGSHPALFRPGRDAVETLELVDDTMIGGISRVHTAIERRRPHPGRLRLSLLGGGATIVLALALFWLPGAMIEYTASVIPAAKRASIGQSVLTNIRRVAGKPCVTPAGQTALERMRKRLLGNTPGRLVVVSGGVAQSRHLPGGIILLNRALIEDYEDPEVVAGHILIENLRARQTDPVIELLQYTGLISAFRLLTTGNIAASNLDSYTETFLTEADDPVPQDQVLSAFKAAAIRTSPYAYAMDISGETTIALIEADPVTPETTKPVLNDGDWVALQGICGE
ncbi:MAG: hypothetical protein WBN04_12340 [Paracoccaceae bacterium]